MREKYIIVTLWIYFSVAIYTQLLSLVHFIHFYSSLLLIVAITGVYLYTLYPFRNEIKKKLSGITAPGYLMAICISVLLLLTFSIAVYFPPSNWDSMTYHLSRVLFWINNSSVEHFATSNTRQLFLGPLAEYCIMHLYLIFNDDYLINLVQWQAYFNIIILVSLVLKNWNFNNFIQLFSGLFFATLPIAILESTTTQNDLFISQLVVATVYFTLKKNTSIYFIACILGLAILTKATSLLFLFPFIVYYIYKQYTIGFTAFKPLSILAGFILLISTNITFFTENYSIYGDPIGLAEGKVLSNTPLGITSTVSNITRNIAWQLSGEDYLLSNSSIHNTATGIHRLIGANIIDPGTTFGDSFYLCIHNMVTSEDYASNPFHLLVILISAFLVIVIYKEKEQVAYTIACISAFILFCFYLKWQPYHSRLLLPVYTLFIPVIGIFLHLLNSKVRTVISIVCIAALMIFTPKYFLHNELKPLANIKELLKKDRLELMLMKRPELLADYKKIISKINRSECKKIAVKAGYEEWEYPILKYIVPHKTITHTAVNENFSKKLEKQSDYCMLLELDNFKNICKLSE